VAPKEDFIYPRAQPIPKGLCTATLLSGALPLQTALVFHYYWCRGSATLRLGFSAEPSPEPTVLAPTSPLLGFTVLALGCSAVHSAALASPCPCRCFDLRAVRGAALASSGPCPRRSTCLAWPLPVLRPPRRPWCSTCLTWPLLELCPPRRPRCSPCLGQHLPQLHLTRRPPADTTYHPPPSRSTLPSTYSTLSTTSSPSPHNQTDLLCLSARGI
jgi:hypothetical protein